MVSVYGIGRSNYFVIYVGKAKKKEELNSLIIDFKNLQYRKVYIEDFFVKVNN